MRSVVYFKMNIWILNHSQMVINLLLFKILLALLWHELNAVKKYSCLNLFYMTNKKLVHEISSLIWTAFNLESHVLLRSKSCFVTCIFLVFKVWKMWRLMQTLLSFSIFWTRNYETSKFNGNSCVGGQKTHQLLFILKDYFYLRMNVNNFILNTLVSWRHSQK